MDRNRGAPGEAWSRGAAGGALARSARRAAARPRGWWAGLAFAPLLLSLWLGGRFVLLPVWRLAAGDEPAALPWTLQGLAVYGLTALLLTPLLLAGARVAAGLARCEAPGHAGGAGGFGHLWRAGLGQALPGLGLWATSLLLLVAALATFVGPTDLIARLAGIGADDALGKLVRAPALVLFGAYAAALEVLFQLALHSLAGNRRGVASALVHGWRLMRNDARGALRAATADLLLLGGVGALGAGLAALLELAGAGALSLPLLAVLAGWAGLARAGFWARAYRGLGGVWPEDGVPGLGTRPGPPT